MSRRKKNTDTLSGSILKSPREHSFVLEYNWLTDAILKGNLQELFKDVKDIQLFMERLKRFEANFGQGSSQEYLSYLSVLLSEPVSRSLKKERHPQMELACTVFICYRLLDYLALSMDLSPLSWTAKTPHAFYQDFTDARLAKISFKRLGNWPKTIISFRKLLKQRKQVKTPESNESASVPLPIPGLAGLSHFTSLLSHQHESDLATIKKNLQIASLHLSYLFRGHSTNDGPATLNDPPDLPSDVLIALKDTPQHFTDEQIRTLKSILAAETVNQTRSVLLIVLCLSPIVLLMPVNWLGKSVVRVFILKLAFQLASCRRPAGVIDTERCILNVLRELSLEKFDMDEALDKLCKGLPSDEELRSVSEAEANWFLNAIVAPPPAPQTPKSTPAPVTPPATPPVNPGSSNVSTAPPTTPSTFPPIVPLPTVPSALASNPTTPATTTPPVTPLPTAPPAPAATPTPSIGLINIGPTTSIPASTPSIAPATPPADVSTGQSQPASPLTPLPSLPATPQPLPPASPQHRAVIDLDQAAPGQDGDADPHSTPGQRTHRSAFSKAQEALLALGSYDAALDDLLPEDVDDSEAENPDHDPTAPSSGDPTASSTKEEKGLTLGGADPNPDVSYWAYLAETGSRDIPIDIEKLYTEPETSFGNNLDATTLIEACEMTQCSIGRTRAIFRIRSHDSTGLIRLSTLINMALSRTRIRLQGAQPSEEGTIYRTLCKAEYESLIAVPTNLEPYWKGRVLVISDYFARPECRTMDFEDALGRFRPSLRSVIDITDFSNRTGPQTTRGKVQDFLDNLSVETSQRRILLSRGIPVTLDGLEWNPFASERVAYDATFQDLALHEFIRLPSLLRSASLATAGAIQRWQIAPDGYGHCYDVIKGLVVFIVDRPSCIDNLAFHLASIQRFFGANGPLFNPTVPQAPGDDVDIIVAPEGARVIMPPNTVHFMYYAHDSIIETRKFFSSQTMSLSFCAIANQFVLEDFITTPETVDFWALLRRKMAFQHACLVRSNKVSASSKRHVLELDGNFHAVKQLFALVALCVLSNSLHVLTYVTAPGLELEVGLEMLSLHDYGAIAFDDRRKWCYIRGLALETVRWFSFHYQLLDQDGNEMAAFWETFILYQAVSLYHYKSTVAQKSPARNPLCSSAAFLVQLRSAMSLLGVETQFDQYIEAINAGSGGLLPDSLGWHTPLRVVRRQHPSDKADAWERVTNHFSAGCTPRDKLFFRFVASLSTNSFKRAAEDSPKEDRPSKRART